MGCGTMIRNRKMCSKCKYRGYFGYKGDPNASEDRVHNHLMCDYAKYANRTCLHEENGVMIDRRGNDPNHCDLFVKGNHDNTRWCRS